MGVIAHQATQCNVNDVVGKFVAKRVSFNALMRGGQRLEIAV